MYALNYFCPKDYNDCRGQNRLDRKWFLLMASFSYSLAFHHVSVKPGYDPLPLNTFFFYKDEELARKAFEAYEEAMSTVNSDGWKVEKQTPEGDVVHSKFIRRNHKVFRLTVSERACSDSKFLF